MCFGDVADDPVLEGAAVMPVTVEGDTAKRRPGLGQDALLGAEALHFSLREVGMDLDRLTAGTTVLRLSSVVRCWTMKLLTPMARTFRSPSSVSKAR